MTGDDQQGWRVELSATAVRSLDRLPPKVAVAVVEFVTVVLPTNPHRLSKPLRFELEGLHVARRGDYRVTFRIDEDDHVLRIGRIEHRAHIYKAH
ncbi:MAG: type II toxin-antitoxin system RelE/ParE family toxin [Actinomycetota bacterium]|nr:type II toxin-antitoxin system RelE/ParE family toxin [Actinomycetota bacterium]